MPVTRCLIQFVHHVTLASQRSKRTYIRKYYLLEFVNIFIRSPCLPLAKKSHSVVCIVHILRELARISTQFNRTDLHTLPRQLGFMSAVYLVSSRYPIVLKGGGCWSAQGYRETLLTQTYWINMRSWVACHWCFRHDSTLQRLRCGFSEKKCRYDVCYVCFLKCTICIYIDDIVRFRGGAVL